MKNLNDLASWANNNQGVLAIIIFILGAFLFKNRSVLKKFTQKAGKNSTNYQAENLEINNHE